MPPQTEVAAGDYRKIIANLAALPVGASFASIYPDMAKEWHTEKNAPLQPAMFAPKAIEMFGGGAYKRGMSGERPSILALPEADARTAPTRKQDPITTSEHYALTWLRNGTSRRTSRCHPSP